MPIGSADNYFHFLTDLAPRAWAATRRIPETVVTLSGPPAPYVSQVLDLLGIQWDVWTDLQPASCDDVVLVDGSPPAWPHPDLLTAFRDAVLDAIAAAEPSESPPIRAYLSRAGSARAMVGESRLEDELVRQGVSSVRLEELSFLEQVRLMRASRLVVAPHGAGLANLIFLRPEARIIELTTGEWWSPCFRNVASIMGLEHRLVVLPRTDEHPFGNASDALAALQEELGRPVPETAP